LRQLVEIYQQEHEWPKAVSALEKLEQVTGNKKSATIAQFHCELAEASLQQNDDRRARDHIATALRDDPACVRASLLEASLDAIAGRPQKVIGALQRVEGQDPDFLPEVLEPMVQAYETLGRSDEALDYVKRVYEKHGGISVLLALTELLRKRDGEPASAAFLSEQLRRKPSVRGLHRLIEMSLEHSEGEARENLVVLKELTSKLTANRPVYKCRHCGFNAKSLHWQCPGCKTWNSLKPVQGVDGE
jgi:lipopolysaccharide biosynthesis regulator YciM